MVGTISAFNGGIANSGTISTLNSGILVGGKTSGGGSVTISTPAGGIANSGTISAICRHLGRRPSVQRLGNDFDLRWRHRQFRHDIAGAYGVVVGGFGSATISTFSGGVSNSGDIVASTGGGIYVGGFGSKTIGTFFGGVTNSGTIRRRA